MEGTAAGGETRGGNTGWGQTVGGGAQQPLWAKAPAAGEADTPSPVKWTGKVETSVKSTQDNKLLPHPEEGVGPGFAVLPAPKDQEDLC